MIKKLMDEHTYIGYVDVEQLMDFMTVGAYSTSIGRIKSRNEIVIIEKDNEHCWVITESFKKWAKEKSPEFYRTLKLTLIENE